MLTSQKSQFSFIYALVDPRTGCARYIGYTNNLKRRLNDHIRTAMMKPYLPNTCIRNDKPDEWFCESRKSAWIRSLIHQGLLPEISLILEVEDKSKAYFEGFWGLIYADSDLLNDKPFYKQVVTGI